MPQLDVALLCGMGAMQITASLLPLPWLAPTVNVLCAIVQLCQNVTNNRNLIHQLRDRCYLLVLVLRDCEKTEPPERLKEATDASEKVLLAIHKEIEVWLNLSRIQAFARQKQIFDTIQCFHGEISNCVTKIEIVSLFEIHKWQTQFEANQKRDHNEVIEYLSEIQNSQAITNEVLAEASTKLTSIMGLMQEALGGIANRSSRVHNGLQSNLYQIALKSGELLPDFNLKRGEVSRVGQFPVSGNATMDIWEGWYLQGEKVAIKIIRAVHSDQKSLRRFMREVKIWSEVWRVDRGKHILPFYGFCQDDGPYPYMISPWQKNGNAINYVTRKGINDDYRALIRGIAEGLRVLHTMEPPVLHGDLKGANIVIDMWGRPLLADFGLTRVVEDITGIPFTQSRGISESYRWFSPEVCVGPGILSTRSDVYSFGMTALELITHEPPYSHIRLTTEVVIRSSRGETPMRPTDPRVVARGLDDHLWRIMQRCWALEPANRPTIQDILRLL